MNNKIALIIFLYIGSIFSGGVVCTVSCSNYFLQLIDLIGSIHKNSFNSVEKIIVYDLGLTAEQISYLSKIQKVELAKIEIINPRLLISYQSEAAEKWVKGSFAWTPVVIKQTLERYPLVFWLNAGITVLKDLDNLFEYVKEKGYFFVDVDPWDIRWSATKRIIDFFSLKENILNQFQISSAIQGLSRDYMLKSYIKPMCDLVVNNFDLFIDDGTTPSGFWTGRADQELFSIFVRKLGLKAYKHGKYVMSTENKNFLMDIQWDKNCVNDDTVIHHSRGEFARKDTVNSVYMRDFLKFKE